MESEGKISKGQVAFLTFGGAAGNIIYTFTFVTYLAGRPFFLATLIGVLLNIPLAMWILMLGSHRKGYNIFDILQAGMGKILCKILLVLYILLNIALASCMINMFTGTVKVFFLERTPPAVIMLFIIVICTVFADSGIRTFSCLIEILVTLYMLNYFLGFSLSFTKEFNIEYITPIFDTTLKGFSEGVLLTAGADAECLLVLMMAVGSIDKPCKELASVAKGLASWSFLLSFAIFIMEGIVSNELLSRVAQAGITVSRVLQIGNFIRGLEILLLMTYQYFAVTKIIIFIYSLTESAKKLFNAKKSRLLSILSAAAVFALSLWVNSFNAGYFDSIFLSVYVILPFSLVVLLLASISVKLMDKKGGDP